MRGAADFGAAQLQRRMDGAGEWQGSFSVACFRCGSPERSSSMDPALISDLRRAKSEGLFQWIEDVGTSPGPFVQKFSQAVVSTVVKHLRRAYAVSTMAASDCSAGLASRTGS